MIIFCDKCNAHKKEDGYVFCEFCSKSIEDEAKKDGGVSISVERTFPTLEEERLLQKACDIIKEYHLYNLSPIEVLMLGAKEPNSKVEKFVKRGGDYVN